MQYSISILLHDTAISTLEGQVADLLQLAISVDVFPTLMGRD